MFFKLLTRSRNVLFIVMMMLVLVMSTLYWIIDSRYEDFLGNQYDLSRQSLKGVASEIQQYIYHRRQLANILVTDHQEELQFLVANPNNPEALLKFNHAIKQFYPEAFNFTISDMRGTLLLEDPSHFVGQACQTDIKNFSEGIHLNEIFIHSNPNPDNYHFDVLTEIDDIGGGQKGIFFASLDTRNIQRLIKNGQPSEHHFLLLRKDKQRLIEMTAEGTRAELDRDGFLQEDEVKQIFSAIDIDGSHWQLIDILAPGFKKQTYDNLQRDALLIGVIFLLFSVIFVFMALLHEKKRLIAELEIQSLNELLESRVEKRTKDLHDSKKELSFQATHDHLTGLINRREFEHRLELLIAKAKTDYIESVIIYIDLDQFKIVNDTAGHIAGDKLLSQLSFLLNHELRSADTLARLGGDEFGILLENCPIKKATLIAEQLRNSVNNFIFEWNDRIYHIGMSIGIMLINDETSDITEVMSTVDASCYAAKAKGRNSIHVYKANDKQLQSHRDQMFWSSEAIQAIELGRMELFCQLIKPINKDEPTPWYEILVRIRDKDGILINPDIFIPALECYGDIEQFDLAVTSEALKFMSQHEPVRFNINISGSSIGNKKFHTKIINLLREYSINPAHIVFEITETAMVSNLNIANEFISKVKALGCRIALDDFGSGMSSFAFLKSLDVDYIKLDGSFVKDIHTDTIHYSMVNAISSVAQVMGKSTIAEFVENAEISNILKEIGINYGQGYYYHRPVPLSLEIINNEDNIKFVNFNRNNSA